jgi:hypothetical protein
MLPLADDLKILYRKKTFSYPESVLKQMEELLATS